MRSILGNIGTLRVTRSILWHHSVAPSSEKWSTVLVLHSRTRNIAYCLFHTLFFLFKTLRLHFLPWTLASGWHHWRPPFSLDQITCSFLSSHKRLLSYFFHIYCTRPVNTLQCVKLSELHFKHSCKWSLFQSEFEIRQSKLFLFLLVL